MSSQYRSILKATSIFGGTQVLQLLIQLIRSKFVAVLVGAAGMGLSSMYMSSLTMIITIFGMGINTSVVRDLSKANDAGDDERFALIIGVFKKMIIVLSILGMVFVIICSPILSNLSFANDEHIWNYCFLSIIVLFSILTQGENALLIGKRRLKDVAKCSLYGSIVTLITSVPFFYFLRLDGIVPGLIVSTIANFLITLNFSRRVTLPRVVVTKADVKSYGISILKLGASMVVASILGNVAVYAINTMVTRIGGIEDLGFFNAGMSLTQNIVLLVFSAMAADYYPRLVASLKENQLMNETINQQTEVLLHLSVPILCLFSILSPVIIRVLLSDQFLVITSFIRILCFGMFFKIISYALGYVSFAYGDMKVYLFLEGVYSNTMNVLLSVGMYYLFGLKGIAYAFVLCFVLYYFIIFYVDRRRYKYQISSQTLKTIVISMIAMTSLLIIDNVFNGFLYYALACVIVIVMSIYNIIELNKKTELFKTIKSFVTR